MSTPGAILDPKVLAEIEKQQLSLESSLNTIAQCAESIDESLTVISQYFMKKGLQDNLFSEKDFQ